MEIQSLSDDAGEKLMRPPQAGTFQDREDLITYVRDFGASQGYVVTIKKSRRDRRVILGCDRGGVYRNRRKIEESKRKRKASSRLINCPFEAIGKKDDDVWVLTVKNGEHNHEALRDMSEHPYSRRFTEEEVKKIKVMTEAGIKPRQVLKALKQSNPEFHSTPRHLYNLKAKIRQGNLTDKTFKSWRPNSSATAFMTGESSTRYNCALKVLNLIGGKFLESQACEIIDVVNPATQEVVSQVPLTTYEEFKAAVRAAKQAFPSWRKTPVTIRQRVMFKLQELIRRDIDKLATNIVTEQGKTLNGAKGDVLRDLEIVEHACGMATLQMGEFFPNACNGIDTYCSREPLGVCAGICPYNFPATISLWMFPIAVTCGNTFILKPSEINPGASMILAELAMEAGLPDGVLNIVHGTHDIVNHICDNDDIKAISLIGSDNAGMHTYARAAARGKRVQSNMGAKNHAIIMPDASFDATLDSLVAAGFGAAGQKCMALSTAIFVGGSRTWEEELVERAKALKVNAGKEPGADIGPVISKEEKDQICRLVQSGVESGARLILDGRNIMVPRYERGNFVGATILCDVRTDMDCYKEEMFGPVLLCMQVDNLEEAMTIVNRQKYENGASIFTTSAVAARKFQNEVDTGLVGVNVPVPVPFSSFNGPKASISGDLYFCSKEGVQFYTKKKTVAQQWRDLPARRLSLPVPPMSEAETSSRALPLAQPPTSDSDVPSREVSPALPSASVRDTASQNILLSSPPLSESGLPNPRPLLSIPSTTVRELSVHDGSPHIPSISKRASVNQEISLAIPLASENDLPVQGASNSGETLLLTSPRTDTHLSTYERTYMPPASRRTGNMAVTHVSESLSVTTSHRKNDILGFGKDSMAQKFQRTDINFHPTSESVYTPTAPQRTDNPSGHPNSGRFYILPPQNGINVMSLGTDATLHHPASERAYIPTSYRNEMFPSQRTDSVPPTSEKMYLSSGIQRNDGLALSSERLYIPATSTANSQGMYGPSPVYLGEYAGQGASPTTSQRL